MGNCHYCMNCGRCRGETPPPVVVHRCVYCSHVNPHGSLVCEKCGESLALDPSKVIRKPGGAKRNG